MVEVRAEKKLKVAINGFGRIGRTFVRCWHGRKNSLLDVVAINDSGGVKQASHLLKYDSTLGTFAADVKIIDDSTISVDGKPIKVVSSRDPTQLPWKAMEVDLVIEGTGVFIDKVGAGKHILVRHQGKSGGRRADGGRAVAVGERGSGCVCASVGSHRALREASERDVGCWSRTATGCLPSPPAAIASALQGMPWWGARACAPQSAMPCRRPIHRHCPTPPSCTRPANPPSRLALPPPRRPRRPVPRRC